MVAAFRLTVQGFGVCGAGMGIGVFDRNGERDG